MKTKSTNYWLFITLGFLCIAIVTFVFLHFYRGLCLVEIMNGTTQDPDTDRYNLGVDLMYIPGSLLLTGLLFYLAGRYFGGSTVDTSDDVSQLKKRLKECQNQYDELMVQTSGGKIETSSKSPKSASSNLTAESPSRSEEMTEIDRQIEEKKQQARAARASEDKGIDSSSFNEGAAKSAFGKKIKHDDLKLVEGIGPKIESILKGKGITTWKELAQTNSQKITDYLLEEGGAAYKIHDPSTWPKQAQLAAEGKFEELKELQDKLKGGRPL